MHSRKQKKRKPDSPDVFEALRKRMLRIAIFDRVSNEGGIDVLSGHRFQALGLMSEGQQPATPRNISRILADPLHPSRLVVSDGPFVFVRKKSETLVVEVSTLLLNADRAIRQCAHEYLKSSSLLEDPWLTPATLETIEKLSADSESNDATRWRNAGIAAVSDIRDDFFACLAGLRQSLAAHYMDGLNDCFYRVMRPSFNSLNNLRPPLWSPIEQREEIRKWIAEFAQMSNLADALTAFLPRCGYVPLCDAMGASELVRQWTREHSTAKVDWEQLESWAESSGSPIAKYHICAVALNVRSIWPERRSDRFWNSTLDVLDSERSVKVHESKPAMWPFYRKLAAHFAWHIEALHPGQDGTRIACYAWWVTQMVAPILRSNSGRELVISEDIIRNEAKLSFSRWSIARSPTRGSDLRTATQLVGSAWAMSMFAQLSNAAEVLPAEVLSEETQHCLAEALCEQLLTAPTLSQNKECKCIFAFDEKQHTKNLLERSDLLSKDGSDALKEMLAVRLSFEDVERLRDCLMCLDDLPELNQRAFVMFLKSAVSSSTSFDEEICTWLKNDSVVIRVLQKIPDALIWDLVETLIEFQQRQDAESAIRLPHLFAYAMENTDEPRRADAFFASILAMSVNVGIASPIQRAFRSKWRGRFWKAIGQWRYYYLNVARYSEPWVSARVRAISAEISRIIGPSLSDSAELPPR